MRFVQIALMHYFDVRSARIGAGKKKGKAVNCGFINVRSAEAVSGSNSEILWWVGAGFTAHDSDRRRTCLRTRETEPQIGQFLQAALLLPAGKRPKKAKKPDCVPIWWLSGHITAKKSQIWLDISQISSTFEQLQLARAATAALCAPSKRQIWPYMALLRR